MGEIKLDKMGWERAVKECEQLAEGVIKSGFKPDVMVGISRGGLVPARILADMLGIMDLYVMKIEFYKSIAETKGFPQVKQSIPVSLEGKKVLIVDDIADTGRSLAVAKDQVKRAGASEVKIAVMNVKPTSIIAPDYFIGKTDAWIVHPWELREAERDLGRKL